MDRPNKEMDQALLIQNLDQECLPDNEMSIIVTAGDQELEAILKK